MSQVKRDIWELKGIQKWISSNLPEKPTRWIFPFHANLTIFSLLIQKAVHVALLLLAVSRERDAGTACRDASQVLPHRPDKCEHGLADVITMGERGTWPPRKILLISWKTDVLVSIATPARQIILDDLLT